MQHSARNDRSPVRVADEIVTTEVAPGRAAAARLSRPRLPVDSAAAR
jgi:hypothetical protein